MISEQFKEKIIGFLSRKVNPSIIYLFGSYAQNTENPNSDVDLAFLSDDGLSEKDRFFLAQELASDLNKDVDLIDLSTATDVLAFQVLKNGIVLYESNPSIRAYYELKVMKKYAKLNEERAEYINDFLDGGSGHG